MVSARQDRGRWQLVTSSSATGVVARPGASRSYAGGETIPGRIGDEIDTLMSEVGNRSAGRSRLQVLSGIGNIMVLDFDVAATLAALGAGDAQALQALDLEFVPFWCPRCDAAYCGRHWITWDLDDDGFFDEKRSRCPAGHERRLLD